MLKVAWDDIARRPRPSGYLDPLVARQKREAHLALLRRWLNGRTPQDVLKTDLFEEAFGGDHLLEALVPGAKRSVGMDIAPATVAAARLCEGTDGLSFLAADVRALSLRQDSFDLVFSNSTLDHFETAAELRTSLQELVRVLRPGGLLVITLDNPWNPLYPLLRRAMRLRRTPFLLGRTASRRQLCAWLAECGMVELDHDWLIHNPRLVSTVFFLALRKALGRAADGPVEFLLKLFALGGRLPTRPLTACFLAVCAQKPEIQAER